VLALHAGADHFTWKDRVFAELPPLLSIFGQGDANQKDHEDNS
jgi:hypothetical protein